MSAENETMKLPDGWKTYDKYQIRHTDGTPLKGKRYFVLRLDSDDPLEAARVAAAMSAYKGEAHSGNAYPSSEASPRSGCPSNGAKMREAVEVILRLAKEDLKDLSDEVRKDFISIRGWCDHALSKPPRQCDVGTAEEHRRRYDEWCNHDGLRAALGKDEFDWALMPYNESEVAHGNA